MAVPRPHPPAGPGGLRSAIRTGLTELARQSGLDTWTVSRRCGDLCVALEGVPWAPAPTPWAGSLAARICDGRLGPLATTLPGPDGGLLGPDGAILGVALTDDNGTPLGSMCGVGAGPREAGELAGHLSVVAAMGTLLGQLWQAELAAAHAGRQLDRRGPRDSVTGLATAATWERCAAAEEERCAEFALAAAVVVVELDGLGALNAAGGYDAGDRALRTLGALLREHVRADDLPARLAGARFAVLLPDTSPDAAAAVATRLTAAAAAATLPIRLGIGLRPPGATLGQARREAEQQLPTPGRRAAEQTPARALAQTPAGLHRDVEQLLASVHRHLGAGAVVVTELRGGRHVVRHRLGQHRHAPQIGTEVSRWAAEAWPATAPVVLPGGRVFGLLAALGGPEPQLPALQVAADALAALLHRDESGPATRGRRQELLGRIDRLLADGGPQMVLQPIVSLRDGTIAGYEALSRFPDSGPGEGPEQWFAAATEVGAGRLELAAARNALALPALPGFLAINLSPSTARTPEALRMLAQAPLSRLVLELTEHEAISDYVGFTEAIAPLRAQGMRIAVDDTGAGFASLRHVLLLQPEVIKLDLSLVRHIDADGSRAALAGALVDFAQRTGATVTAEGVQTEAELAVLRRLGVHFGQGFFLGRPVSAGEAATHSGQVHPLPRLPRPRAGKALDSRAGTGS